MADYIDDISTIDYIYLKEISVSEIGGEDHTDFPIKLVLNSTNFNFDLANSDGSDLRVGEGSNGTRILNMWIATWDTTNRVATIWLKLPSLLADETKTLYVYWGNSSATTVSNKDDLGFWLVEGFDDNILDNIAIGKTTDQSSTRLSYYSSRAVDGDTATWSETNSGPAEWWKIDLGEEVYIQSIRIIKYYSTTPYYYYVQTADDWAFTVNVQNIITATNEQSTDKTYNQSYFSGMLIRYLRIYIHTFDQSLLIKEFYVTAGDSPWVYSNVAYSGDSKIRLNTDGYIEPFDQTFLEGRSNWIVEEGVFVNAGTDSTYQTHRYIFYGTENPFSYYYYLEGDTDRRSNLVDSSTFVTYNGTERGLESDSYSENFISYYEPTDKVYQGMSRRNTYSDYVDSVERQVEDETKLTYFRLYGRNNAAAPFVDIDWILVREFTLTDPYTFNTDNLLVSWEEVDHETINWIDYDSDSTSESYYHYSSYGGNPYRLSDNSTGSLTDCWFSDSSETVSEIDLVIDFGRLAANLVSEDYLHYDSGHVGYKNASKLSNDDGDVWGNDHFEATTTSGYVAIDFGYNATPIECVAVKAHTTASGMMKNFTIDGSYVHPILADPNEWENLYTGTFTNTLDWQTVYFTNGKPFRYYRIYFLDTYNNKPATLQEWAMHGHFSAREKKIISQLRIRPTTLSSNEVCFPRYIILEGSNGLGVWDTLIPTQKTYTPFYDYMWERWQRYSFTNTKGFYQYRLTCSGTWGTSATQMSISEWEMVERLDELHKYRVVGGSSSDFNNIWANNDTTFDGGFIYITNDNLNVIKDNKLTSSTSIAGTIIDLNVV